MNNKIIRYILGVLVITLSLMIPITGYFLSQPSPLYAALFIWLPALLSFTIGIIYFYIGARKIVNFSAHLSLILGFSVLVIVGVDIVTSLMLGGSYGEIQGPLFMISNTLISFGLLIALISGVIGVIGSGNAEKS
ncbi:MAG: hypothetical protein HYT43_02585 [Candidatus Taylorbacteria bacterium]|nr:hypothetical protein [Candidatus Taylorbacteria bacterium]